jgi:FKBP12-rapamycin complex-associated protein
MLARYREVCATVLKFRDSKEKLIRKAVITLLPRLAAFAPERFVKSYLKESVEHLLSVLTQPAERGAGFTATAELASALAKAGVGHKMKEPVDYLRPIALQIRESLAPSRNRAKMAACTEPLDCAGRLATALREDWQPYMLLLLEPMLQTGLSGRLNEGRANTV